MWASAQCASAWRGSRARASSSARTASSKRRSAIRTKPSVLNTCGFRASRFGAREPGIVEDRGTRFAGQRALVVLAGPREILPAPVEERDRLVGLEAPQGVAHARERRDGLIGIPNVGRRVAEQQQAERGARL